MKIRLENIVFWGIITLLILLAFWMLIGTPTDTSAIVALAVFTATSEVLLWKTFFSIDKKTAIGFEKIKNDIDNLGKELKNRTNKIKELIKK